MPVLGRYIFVIVDSHYVRMKLEQGNSFEQIHNDCLLGFSGRV
jgi:hypothetical protein